MTSSNATRAGVRAALLAAALIAAGCISTAPSASGVPTNSPGVQPSAAPSSRPSTPFESILTRIGPDGHLSKDDALALFATVFGPLPGVSAPHDPTGVRDGTLAIREVLRYEDELSSEQLESVQAHLAPPEGAEILTVPPNTDLAVSMRLAVGEVDALKQALEGAKDQFRRAIAQRVGEFDGTITIHFAPKPPGEKGKLLGQAWSDWPGGTFDDCDVYLFPDATNAEPLVMLNTLAHEMFHCFQFAAYGNRTDFEAVPAWILEGQAEWVGNVVGGVDTSDWKMWERYLTMPHIPLTQRSYDAIGFYSHLDNTGTDPWTIFRPMWQAGSNSVEAFRAAGADRDAFLGSWPSSVFREPAALGAAWDTTGPGITPDKYAPPRMSIANGGRLDISAPFLANDGDFVAVSADVLHVQVDGHARLSDGSVDTTSLEDAWFCIAGWECACPDDTPLPVPIVGTLSGDLAIASTGGADGTLGTATGVGREELCRETPEPSAEPTGDEFCERYRALLEWGRQHADTDFELSQPWAAEIARRMQDMRPYAPSSLLAHVDLYIRVYGTYATAPEPMNVPIVGPEAAGIATAAMAMNAHCGVTS